MAIAEFEPGPNEVAILPTEPPSDIRLKAVPRVGTKRACTHCLLAIPQGEVAPHGYCRVCLPEEGPPIEFLVEQAAVRACRAAGLRAMARPCAWEDCKPDSRAPCASCRPFHDRRPSPVEVAKKERSTNFTDRDESDLRRYFSKTQKTGIGVGSSSGFTMMCDRIGEAVNFKSKEQPQRTEPRCPICAAQAVSSAKQKTEAAITKRIATQRAADLLDVIVGDETLETAAPAIERLIPVVAEVPNELREALVEAAAEAERGNRLLESIHAAIVGNSAASPLTATHRHSKSDLEDFKPIRHYDREVIVDGKTQLVQVAVYPPSLEPLTYESHRVPTHGSSGAGKFGSWDDEAVDYVEGRSSETLVNRVLAKLPERSRDLLEAFYTQTEELTVRSGSDSLLGAYAEVALVTEAAQKAHNDAAEGGQVATVRDVVEALKKRASGTSTNREAAVKRLETMRSQAEELVLKAQIAYAWAAAHS